MNTYEISATDYTAYRIASKLLEVAGLEVTPKPSRDIRGFRTGSGCSPIGDSKVYRADVKAAGLDAIKSAIPAEAHRMDLNVHNIADYGESAYLSYSRYLYGEWRH